MATTPIFAPGEQMPRLIPAEQADAALAHGGTKALQVLDPQGNKRWIPEGMKDAALAHGGKLVDDAAAPAPGAPQLPAAAASQTLNQNQEGMQPKTFWERLSESVSKTMEDNPYAASTIGVLKGAGDTSHGIGTLIHKIPLVGDKLVPKEGLDAMDQMDEAHGVMQHVGKGEEAVMEFMGGDAAIKSLSMIEKLQHLQQVAKFMKAYPKLGAMIAHGISNLGLGTVQNTLKEANPDTDLGDTVENAGEESAIGAGAGAVLEGGSGVVKKVIDKVRPTETTIAGETMPKLASQERGAAPLAGKVANINSEASYAEAQQQGSQRAIKNVARSAGQNALEKNFPGTGAKAAKVTTFGEAADKLREEAKPIYDQLDKESGGKFSELNKARAAGYSKGDFDAVKEANDGIEKLFNNKQTTLKPEQLKAGRDAFHQSYILDDVHDAVNKAFNIGDEEIAQKAGLERGISGGRLMNRLNSLIDRVGKAKVQSVISSEGLQNLYRIADLTQTPQRAREFGDAVDGITHAMTPDGTKLGFNVARRMLLHSVATNPKVAQYLDLGIKLGASPKVVAPTISAIMREANAKGEDEQ